MIEDIVEEEVVHPRRKEIDRLLEEDIAGRINSVFILVRVLPILLKIALIYEHINL